MMDLRAVPSSWSIAAGGLQTPVISFGWDINSVMPPGKWLRWKITGGANWRAVFRIMLTAVQGRGGSFKHATVPLPEDARKHPHDHAHAAQALLRMRAAHGEQWGVYSYSPVLAGSGRAGAGEIDPAQPMGFAAAHLSKLRAAITLGDEDRMRGSANGLVDRADEVPGEPPPDPDDVGRYGVWVAPGEPPPDPDDVGWDARINPEDHQQDQVFGAEWRGKPIGDSLLDGSAESDSEDDDLDDADGEDEGEMVAVQSDMLGAQPTIDYVLANTEEAIQDIESFLGPAGADESRELIERWRARRSRGGTVRRA